MAATILTVTDLSQRFGTELIFSGISFLVTEREHLSLVGVNGSGKSTLLHILAGLREPAGGVVSRSAGLRVAYQAQEARFSIDRSLYDEALDAFSEVRAIGARLSVIEQEMALVEGEQLDQLFDEYSRLSSEFEARHGYEMEHRTAQVLGGLGFPETMFDDPVLQLSGGQKTRVALAKALLSDPDLLLLDEPTNHLDLAAIEWLEGFLQGYPRAFIIVSHDRYFLEKTTTRTLELHFGRMEEYPAGYLGYLKLRAERRTRQQKEYEEQQEFIGRTEEFIRKYKAGQRSREAKGRETRLARLERIEAPQEVKRFKLNMRASVRSGQSVLAIRPLTIGYPARPGEDGPSLLVRTPELVIERGDRVALIGPNGAGKTTALRTIVGELPALKGAIEFGTNVKLAYYAQGHEGLDPARTALDTILHDQPIGEEVARNLLGAFLFSDDDVYKPVSALSGGERSRLALARLTLAKANFLVLDEPTNHLDIPARETLEEGLAGYDGTLLFVSHDRFFIDRVATRVWAIEDGRLAQYLGNYSDMLNDRARRNGQLPAPAPKQPEPAAVEQPEPDAQRAKPRPRQYDKLVRESQRRLAAAERTVSKLEDRLMEIEERLSRASIDQQLDLVARLGLAHEETQRELDLAYAEWSAAGAELEELTAQAALAAEGA